MGIINVKTDQVGLAGEAVKTIYIDTNDLDATILTTGYLNEIVNSFGIPLSEKFVAIVSSKASASAASKSSLYLVRKSGSDWSLAVPPSSGGGSLTGNETFYTETDETATAPNSIALEEKLEFGSPSPTTHFSMVANKLSVSGTDANQDMELETRGTGVVSIVGESVPGKVKLFETPANGSNSVIVSAAPSAASDYTLELPDAGSSSAFATILTGASGATASSKWTSNSTDGLLIPSGTTAQRPADEVGVIRYNSTTAAFEGNSGSGWNPFGEATGLTTFTGDISDSSGNSFVISANACFYQIINGRIFFDISLTWTGKGSAVAGDNLRVALPFGVLNESGYRPVFSVAIAGSGVDPTGVLQGTGFANLSYVTFLKATTGGATSFTLVSDASTTGTLSISGSYIQEP